MRGSRRRWFPVLLACVGGLADVAGAQSVDSRSGAGRWGRNYFPNVPLVTQDGEPVRFFDDLIEGKVVAINFIYTHCPDSCPLETARLLEVQEILEERMGKDVFFYSISIDPERDTPEVLKKYKESFQVGPGWTFLTGKEEDIALLRRKLGLYIDEIQEEGSLDHNLSLIIGNQATGQWMKSSPFENPYVLASKIGDWLHNWKMPREENGYENAPKLRNLSKGETIFRTRCAACHAIGDSADGVFRVGPNLLGVTERRERDWLVRWLTDPPKMRAEKDPIAMELFESYNRVKMPNLYLNPREIDRLLEYIETESRRIQTTERIEKLTEDFRDADGPSCCQKEDELVIGAEDTALPAEDEGAAAALPPPSRPKARPRLSGASLVSMGLGGVLGVLTLALRRRTR